MSYGDDIGKPLASTGDKMIDDWYGLVDDTVDGAASSWDDVANSLDDVADDALAAKPNTGYNGSAGAGETFTQGTTIPDEISITKPPYSPNTNRWLENGGTIKIDDGTWKYTNAQGLSVTYKNGYPDFKGSGFVQQEVDIGPFTNRTADFKLADQLAPNGPKNALNTWHHHENGKTLQEVNRRIHEMFTHRGGISIMKRGG